MQAIRIHEYGDADVCRLESVEVPRPGVGEVLIKVEVAGLNFIDVHLRLGLSENQTPTATPCR